MKYFQSVAEAQKISNVEEKYNILNEIAQKTLQSTTHGFIKT